jgi:hypothetical protein
VKNFIHTLLLAAIVLLIYAIDAHSQNGVTKIMGKVIDASMQKPIPFVNIYIKGTTIGTRTDFNGEYSIEFKDKADSLTASYIGYATTIKPIVLHKFQTIDYQLLPDKYNLNEVVIKPTVNPAEVLLQKIIDNKPKNSGEQLNAYQYEAYSKVELDANNVTKRIQKKWALYPFRFVFKNIDTSTVNGKSYLPIMLSEILSDVYYRSSPKSKKEVIKASKISGVDNASVTQFLGDLYQGFDIYKNFIMIFQMNFISPIANFGLDYYRYYLTDSAYIGNKWCYKIMFKPRRKQELTFTGNFWVADTSFAIKKIDMRAADDANINYVNAMVSQQEFDKVDSSQWMPVKEKLIVDFNIIDKTKKVLGFFGTKTSTYKNFVLNKPLEDKFYSKPTNISFNDNSLQKSDTFWSDARHDSLSKNEKSVYKMMDTLNKIPLFKIYVTIVKTLAFGYYIWKDIEIGPYFNMFSENTTEGMRFCIGARTSPAFSKKLMLNAHVAYGTTDEVYKYGGGFIYMLNKNPRKSFSVNYSYDIEQLGEDQNAFVDNNIFASVLKRDPYNKLSMDRQYNCVYENEWFNGFSNSLSLVHRQLFPIGNTIFTVNDNGVQQQKSSITTSEVNLNTRFAFHEKFIYGQFDRMSLGTTYPILNLEYAYGIKGCLNSDFNYQRLKLEIEQWFNVGSIGWSKYIIEAGRIWGKVPYPLLKLHEGNETWIWDDYAYNLMNYYEFVSDKYISLFYVHHFNGFFFNKVPLFRKLKWREMASVRAVVGGLNNKTMQYAELPSFSYLLKQPYYEASVGVENIFKILEVHAVWRLSYLYHPDITRFGIMATLRTYF